MFGHFLHRSGALALALALALASTACTGPPDPVDDVMTPPSQDPPPLEPSSPAQDAECPTNSPVRHDYGAPGTKFYPQASDYRAYFDGFNICTPQAGSGLVLYNNTAQIWAIDPSLQMMRLPGASSPRETAFFREQVVGQPSSSFLMPGEIAVPLGGLPPVLPWAPDPTLTAAWVSQGLAMENLKISADSGDLAEDLLQHLRARQLQATNPVGAALLGCARSGYDVGARAAVMDEETEFITELQWTLDGAHGASTCANDIRKTYKDAEKGRSDWLTRVERSTRGASKGVGIYQAIKPVWESCQAVRVLPKVGSLVRFCR